MTTDEANKLRPGARVYNGSLKGVVTAVDLHTVWLRWDDRYGEDCLRRTSPLLLFLDVEDRR